MLSWKRIPQREEWIIYISYSRYKIIHRTFNLETWFVNLCLPEVQGSTDAETRWCPGGPSSVPTSPSRRNSLIADPFLLNSPLGWHLDAVFFYLFLRQVLWIFETRVFTHNGTCVAGRRPCPPSCSASPFSSTRCFHTTHGTRTGPRSLRPVTRSPWAWAAGSPRSRRVFLSFTLHLVLVGRGGAVNTGCLKTTLLRYNLHILKFTHFQFTWFLVNLEHFRSLTDPLRPVQGILVPAPPPGLRTFFLFIDQLRGITFCHLFCLLFKTGVATSGFLCPCVSECTLPLLRALHCARTAFYSKTVSWKMITVLTLGRLQALICRLRVISSCELKPNSRPGSTAALKIVLGEPHLLMQVTFVYVTFIHEQWGYTPRETTNRREWRNVYSLGKSCLPCLSEAQTDHQWVSLQVQKHQGLVPLALKKENSPSENKSKHSAISVKNT